MKYKFKSGRFKKRHFKNKIGLSHVDKCFFLNHIDLKNILLHDLWFIFNYLITRTNLIEYRL